jgi:hypothetical protein
MSTKDRVIRFAAWLVISLITVVFWFGVASLIISFIKN